MTRPHYLTGNPLDRREDLRRANTSIERLLDDERNVVIPVHGSASLVRGGAEAIVVEGSPARQLLAAAETVALLGEASQRLHWLATVDDTQAARLAGRHDARFTGLRAVSALLPHGSAALLVHARALAHFHRTHRWCGRCGGAMESRGLGNWRECASGACTHQSFPRTDPAIIVRVAQGERCLLIRQPEWRPRQFATVAGFVEPGESLEEAAAREIREETGLDAVAVRYHSSQPWPFPSSIMIGFDAEVSGELRLDSDEVEEARWFTRGEMTAAAAAGEIRLPSEFSISRRLISDWLDGSA